MTITADAIARIPGYVNTGADAERINALTTDLVAADWAGEYRNAQATFQHLIETTHDVEDLRAAFAAMNAAQVGIAAYNEIQQRLRDLTKSRRDAAQSFSGDVLAPALRFLHERLGELMAKVRNLDDTLGPVSSIDAAIRGSDEVITAWRDIETATNEYDEIRRAQNTITLTMHANASPKTGEALRWTGRLRNAFEFESSWVTQRRAGVRGPVAVGGTPILDWVRNPPTARWDRQPSDVWPAGNKVQYLRWLARTASPWVPTHAELHDAHTALEAVTRPLSDVGQVRHALDAYARYYTRRGVTPVIPLDAAAARADLPVSRGLRDHMNAEGVPAVDPRIADLVG